MDVKGSTAVITGAGSGIGRGLAIVLAQRGCNLALADINAAGLEETARLVASNQIRVTTHVLDVADRDAVAAFPEAVKAAHGGAGLLFNNAGVALSGTFEEISEEDFDWLIGINFWGVIRMTRAFLPLLKLEPKAHIINLSSIFGVIAPPGQTAYSAAKFGVRGFSDALRHELKGSSVGVTTVHPGGVATSIAKSTRMPKGASEADRARQIKFAESMLTMPPERAAETIVRAVEQGKSRLLIGTDAKLAATLERLTPAFYWNILSKVIDR